MTGTAGTPYQLPTARLGDLVKVENQDPGVGSFQWYHIAVVIGVDATGQITRLRQKPDADRFVFDTSADQFMSVDPVRNGEQYELWRDPRCLVPEIRAIEPGFRNSTKKTYP